MWSGRRAMTIVSPREGRHKRRWTLPANMAAKPRAPRESVLDGRMRAETSADWRPFFSIAVIAILLGGGLTAFMGPRGVSASALPHADPAARAATMDTRAGGP